MEEHGFELVAMGASLVCVICAYWIICRKDKSWINWTTSGFIVSLGAGYVFPLASLLLYGNSGSHYAFAYCYAAESLPFLAAAITYAKIRSPRLVANVSQPPPDIGALPWILLLVSWLLYAPILIEFRAYLLHPREIYNQTRTGYGAYFFGSTMFGNLAFVIYLFKKNKGKIAMFFFYFFCAALMYFHGSKGQLLTLVIIRVLFAVYVQQRKVKFLAALAAVSLFAVMGIASFAAFTDFNDLSEILLFVTGYSDYTKNAMMVIDDPTLGPYYGQLTLERAFYSRIPRALMPDKPKDYGGFKLARIYYPAEYREDSGSPDFSVGLDYADFGPFAILWIGFQGMASAYLIGILIPLLRIRPHPSTFIILLYFCGQSMIPAGLGALPEITFLTCVVALALRMRVLPLGFPRLRFALFA